MAGPMPHCAPGKSAVTAAAIRCAVEWRASASASGLWSVTMRTRASLGERVGEVDELVVDDRGEGGLGQAGGDVGGDGGGGVPGRHLPARAVGKRDRDLIEWTGPPGEACPGLEAESNGRHGQTRTADLLRVKQAL